MFPRGAAQPPERIGGPGRVAAGITVVSLLSAARAYPSTGGPTLAGAALYTLAVLALLPLSPPPTGPGRAARGLLLGGLYWGVATIIGGLLGGAGPSGASYEPATLALTSAWASLSGLAALAIAWSTSAGLRSPLAAVAGAAFGALAIAGVQGLWAPWSLSYALAIVLAGLAVAGLQGYWASAAFLSWARVWQVEAPIVGGVTPLPRLAGLLAGSIAVSVASGWRPRASRARGPWLAVAIALAVIVLSGEAAGLRGVVVVSGSMEPGLRIGDIAVVRLGAEPRVGDVILYDHQGSLVIHRLVGAGPTGYTTRGDANPEADPWTVDPGSVRGVMVARIPRLGLPLLWIRGAAGG